jgi:Domain of unknown function (DUF5753)
MACQEVLTRENPPVVSALLDEAVLRRLMGGAMNMITTTLMTYGADLGGMLASLVALATLCLSLGRPRGKHRK